MPKDPTKNVDRYKVRGGQLNEFEYTQSQEAFAEDKQQSGAQLIPGTPPEKQPAVKKAAKKKPQKGAKGTKKTASKSSKRVSAKQSTSRKATKKKATKK